MEQNETSFKVSFLEELQEFLQELEQSLLILEERPGESNILVTIFRIAHNIKGSAAAVGFSDLSGFMHHAESLLVKIKSGEIAVDRAIVDLLLKVNDTLNDTFERLSQDLNASCDYTAITAEILGIQGGDLASTQHVSGATDYDGFGIFESETDPQPQKEKPPAQKVGVSEQKTTNQNESIRISLAKVDHLMNAVGELVILNTLMTENIHLVESEIIRNGVSQMQKIVSDIQDVSMRFRMVPLKQTFQKMQRIVRDTSNALNKRVQLQLAGEETELDNRVVSQIADPLVHLVRNAVDHGIESAEERKSVNKPEAGTILLSASHEGDKIVIEIKDDGKGLDPEKIRQTAIAKGLVTQDHELSKEECLELIFESGFSTKHEVTDISGRGVGMDVVRSNIRALKGELTVDSAKNQGSSFKIHLPLTLAVINAAVVEVENSRFVVPISQISQAIQLKRDEIGQVSEKVQYLVLRGETVTLYKLAKLMKVPEASEKPSWKQVALVLQRRGSQCAVLVDSISNQQQVVMKRLGKEFAGLSGVSGAAILGDGCPAPILDLKSLTDESMRSTKKVA